MKITFKQTGGFAGVVKSVQIDSESIPTPERQALESLVEGSGFWDLSAGEPRQMPDAEGYFLCVESGERSHALHLCGPDVPDQLRPLIRYLAQQSRFEKRA